MGKESNHTPCKERILLLVCNTFIHYKSSVHDLQNGYLFHKIWTSQCMNEKQYGWFYYINISEDMWRFLMFYSVTFNPHQDTMPVGNLVTSLHWTVHFIHMFKITTFLNMRGAIKLQTIVATIDSHTCNWNFWHCTSPLVNNPEPKMIMFKISAMTTWGLIMQTYYCMETIFFPPYLTTLKCEVTLIALYDKWYFGNETSWNLYALNVKSYKTKVFFRLDCKACISPATMNTKEDVTWFYSSIPPNGFVKVEYDDHVLLSQDKVLHMYNLKQENSGQYLCKVGHTVMAPYFLEVVNDNEPIVQASVYVSFYGIYN